MLIAAQQYSKALELCVEHDVNISEVGRWWWRWWGRPGRCRGGAATRLGHSPMGVRTARQGWTRRREHIRCRGRGEGGGARAGGVWCGWDGAGTQPNGCAHCPPGMDLEPSRRTPTGLR